MTVENSEKPKNSSGINDFFMRMGVLGELMAFLWKRKLYWLIPMMLTLLLFAVIIILGNTGVGSVFIYTLF
ncbi:MAG: DUF5989 family protein [Anaerolineae bacterium]|nr:DUF5989 family protein [Anaerolineae bacterium]MDQ7034433.1 DUF5989 family protein [Anaerolineae bacterium]